MIADLSPAPTAGNAHLAERLVANLVDNALRHNVVGGHVIITTGTEGGCAVVTVENSGPVVPAAEIDRLFQPFQRLEVDRTTQTDGHGLGLSIVQAVAAAHGAAVRPVARSEGGLSLEVRFPMGADAVPPALPPGSIMIAIQAASVSSSA